MRNLAAARAQLHYQLQTAQDDGEAEIVDLQKEVVRITREWDRLDRALARRRVGP
jgi:hypothetical protein